MFYCDEEIEVKICECFLPRGSIPSNTEWVEGGLVHSIYVTHETQFRNQGGALGMKQVHWREVH